MTRISTAFVTIIVVFVITSCSDDSPTTIQQKETIIFTSTFETGTQSMLDGWHYGAYSVDTMLWRRTLVYVTTGTCPGGGSRALEIGTAPRLPEDAAYSPRWVMYDSLPAVRGRTQYRLTFWAKPVVGRGYASLWHLTFSGGAALWRSTVKITITDPGWRLYSLEDNFVEGEKPVMFLGSTDWVWRSTTDSSVVQFDTIQLVQID